MADDTPWYAPDRKPSPRRVATPGFKLWELRQGDRVLTCEIRDNDAVGAGVDVQLLEDGELLVSRRCVTGDAARYIAESFKKDHLRTGWTE
jgi:hypothetical protein